MKLRTRFAVVLLLITVVLSASVYGGLEVYKDRVVEQNREDVEETATLSARQLDATVEDRKDFVGFVASRPDAARFDRSDRFLTEFVDNSRFFAAQMVDANGTIVDFHGDVTQDVQRESIGMNIGDRPYVANALDGEVFVSEPEYVNATDQYLVIISAPIFDDRELKGALAAALYLEDRTFFGGLAPVSGDDQQVTVSAGQDTLYQRGERSDDVIEVSRTVESTGWTVTVDRDRSNLVDQLGQLAIAQGLGILLVMLSVVSFGVWEYRTTLAQTEKLLEGFSALQAASFDHELTLANAEEWEQISDGFNALTTGLASRESEIRKRGQRLEVLNRVLRHNLRNYASVVLGYAEVIRTRSDDDGVLDAVGRIESTGTDLESLSAKAAQLEYTLEERGEPTSLDLSGIVEAVVDALREEYPGVDVHASLPDAAWVRADPSLRIAIANVCENACEHNTAPEPRLDIAVAKGTETVTVEVSDNGEGIPDHEWLVLDAGEETPLEHGSGLGLWVAQWAVDGCGGTLQFETNEPRGTTVTIELDAAEPDEDAPDPREVDLGEWGLPAGMASTTAGSEPADGRTTVDASGGDERRAEVDPRDETQPPIEDREESEWEWTGDGD
ncbi:MAG TPA: sensor histidine kinase [Halobacteriales archaeon]|nr:sensor histidine kinase [Halobacteriales archaeon]